MSQNLTDTDVRTALYGLLGSRFPQAVLLVGASAPLREQLSNYIAQSLLCTGATAPCNACNACHKIQQNIHPDCITLAQADGADWKVDQVRELRQQVILKPNDGMRKVFILHDANRMNIQAQNALLKTLEEPPSYAFFVLTCPQTDGLLETIRSRCVTFLLAPDDAQVPDTVDLSSLATFLLALAQAEECGMLQAALAWEKLDKPTFRATITCLQTAMRDAILYGKAPALLPTLTREVAAVHARIPMQKLILLYDHCALLLQRSETNANATVQCAVLCAGAFTICFGEQ